MGLRDLLGQGTPWKDWADAHGFTYQLRADDMARSFLDPPPEGTEEVHHLIGGRWQRVGFYTFYYRLLVPPGRKRAALSLPYDEMHVLAVELPGRLRDDLWAMGPTAAFKALGVRTPGIPANWRFRDPDWMIGTGPMHSPRDAQAALEQLDHLVGLAPPEIFAP